MPPAQLDVPALRNTNRCAVHPSLLSQVYSTRPVSGLPGVVFEKRMSELRRSSSPFVRVGIDTTPLTFPPSGIRTYAEALLRQLRSDQPDVQLTEIISESSWIVRRLPGKPARFWWDTVGVGSASRGSNDLLHVLHGSAPLRVSLPCVVTLHDLIPFTDPDYRLSRSMRVYQAAIERALQRTAAVIAPSSYVADEARRRWGWPEEKLHVIPMAADTRFAPAVDPRVIPQSLTQLGITGPYIFNTGGFDARKNLPVLIGAFARFRQEISQPFQLVIAGAAHTTNRRVYPALQPEIDRLGLSEHILLTGFVSESVKVALYQHAAMYVTPSRSEGFGMTCLEAMACGTPVIAARRTSLPEVVGDAGLLVEPDPETIAATMISLATDEAQRDLLRTRGPQRARQFSWRQTAAMTADVYRSVLEHN